MKRYLCFAFEEYYPEGGMNDFRKDFDDIEEAKEWFYEPVGLSIFKLQVYDQVEKKIILQD